MLYENTCIQNKIMVFSEQPCLYQYFAIEIAIVSRVKMERQVNILIYFSNIISTYK